MVDVESENSSYAESLERPSRRNQDREAEIKEAKKAMRGPPYDGRRCREAPNQRSGSKRRQTESEFFGPARENRPM